MEAAYDYLFKIILIGDSGVGKTSLMKRYTDNVYSKEGASTIGVDFKIKTVVIDGKKIKLQIWDTAGQERFRAIVSHYYRGAHGIMLVFDMLNKETFDHLRDWIEELDRHGVSDAVKIKILGNKIDCADQIRVQSDDIRKFLTDYKIPGESFCEVSAQGGTNVEDSFVSLTRQLVETVGVAGAKPSSKLAFKSKDDIEKRACC